MPGPAPTPYYNGPITPTDCLFITFLYAIRHAATTGVKLCARCEVLVIRRFHFEYRKIRPDLHITPEQAAKERFSVGEYTRGYGTMHQELLPMAKARNLTVNQYLLYHFWLPVLRPTIYYLDSAGVQRAERGPPNENRRSAVDVGLSDCWVKVWMACHGRYTIQDLRRGRPYADPFRGDLYPDKEWFVPSSFEKLYHNWMSLLRLPSLVQNCTCPDRVFVTGDPPLPWTPGERNQNFSDNRTSFRTFLDKYTDNQILDVYKKFCAPYLERGAHRIDQIKPMTMLWREQHPGFLSGLYDLEAGVGAIQAASNVQGPRPQAVQNNPGGQVNQGALQQQNNTPQAEPSYTLAEIEAANSLMLMSQRWNNGTGDAEGQE
ncbi:uncharacterized protein C8A04DRAFT_29651 [Dichotomopilus funicola]|uniref:Uncharacterized protein n=1 Tax=Dichotomopilus funicola TaxID=1934379 RepID=A0AAN6V280_9PEZI|nr:hypothetical protein C8A04DRAFT_29651 [Dichotomopilus funicola]